MLCLQMKLTSLHSIYQTKILSVKTKIQDENCKAKKRLFVGTNQRKSKQVERNPLAKLELNTMLTEDKKTYTYTTHQTKNFKSEVETKTNGDKFDSNAIAKHHR